MIHLKIVHQIPLNTLETHIFVSVNKKSTLEENPRKIFFSPVKQSRERRNNTC